MIGILNYGMGNILSVYNALKFLNSNVILIKPNELEKVDSLVLPGVGAYKDTINLLKPYEKKISSFLSSEKPFLGICIGLQYLYEKSNENKSYNGLGFFKGSIKKLSAEKLPQIGWNTIDIKKNSPLLEDIPNKSYVYYINSYGADTKYASATSNYGKKFAAVVEKNNVFATQFHPEKSGEVGLKILKNFIKVTKKCL